MTGDGAHERNNKQRRVASLDGSARHDGFGGDCAAGAAATDDAKREQRRNRRNRRKRRWPDPTTGGFSWDGRHNRTDTSDRRLFRRRGWHERVWHVGVRLCDDDAADARAVVWAKFGGRSR